MVLGGMVVDGLRVLLGLEEVAGVEVLWVEDVGRERMEVVGGHLFMNVFLS